MWCCWTPLILALTPMLSLIHCQSGDGDGDWGSGFDIHSSNHSAQAVGDEPVRMKNSQEWETSSVFSPLVLNMLHPDPQPDRCSVHFTTDKVLLRMLKAQKEELAYLQAVQRGNQAMVENLVQFLGSEVGEQSYEDVIRENVIGIREEQKKCHEVVGKAEEDLEKQLEGDSLNSLVGMNK